MNSTFLSVLMSARNAERTIRSAVKSTLYAMPADSELLVLLDNSTDDSANVLANIKDKRLRVLFSHERLGINASRNHLAAEAKGPYIGIMDSDDVCLPWRFTEALKKMTKYDAVFSTALVFGARLRPLPFLPQLPLELDPTLSRLMLSLRNPFVHSSAMYRKSDFIRLGGYSKSKSEDYELWLRMVNSGMTLYRNPLPWVAYRFHPSQASQETGFMNQVMSSETLINQVTTLRSRVASELTSADAWSSHVETFVQSLLIRHNSLFKLEFSGLPGFLRSWKQRSIKK